MLAELTGLLAALPASANREDYRTAICEDNVLGKQTQSTRELTDQRLSELYGLDRGLALFRVLRYLWDADEEARPLLAMQCALARDPLLRSTAPSVLGLPMGAELVRVAFLDALRAATGQRLNESSLDKVARNAGSSWCQSGHLAGRVRKVRRRAAASPGALAYALWLGSLDGLAGERLLESRWIRVVDQSPSQSINLALQAKRLGLMHARIGGGVVEIDTSLLDRMALEV